VKKKKIEGRKRKKYYDKYNNNNNNNNNKNNSSSERNTILKDKIYDTCHFGLMNYGTLDPYTIYVVGCRRRIAVAGHEIKFFIVE